MKYGIVFLLVAGILTYYGGLIGGWGWLLLWPALSFSIVALAYLGSGVKVFGKRRDGTIAWYSLARIMHRFLSRSAESAGLTRRATEVPANVL